MEEISAAEARRVSAEHGLTVPEIGEYEGERNAEGKRHGRGTCRYADGIVYDGAWKAGQMEGFGTYRGGYGDAYEGQWKGDTQTGFGTYRFADGSVDVGFWMADTEMGEGVRWSADGRTAWRLRDGEEEEEISLEEARRVAEKYGLPTRPAAKGAGKQRWRCFHFIVSAD